MLSSAGMTSSPRDPSDNALLRLFSIARRCPSEATDFVHALLMGAKLSKDRLDNDTHRLDNDIHVTCVFACINHWRKRISDDIVIVHDESSNFFRHIDLWKMITSPRVLPTTIADGDGHEITFPLRVRDTRPGNSAHSHSLQLCDMIAGLGALLKRESGGLDIDLRKAIFETGFGELIVDALLPGTDFIDGPPSPLDGPDVIDQFISATDLNISPAETERFGQS